MSSLQTRRGRSRISTVGMTRRDTVKSMLFVGGAMVFHGFGKPTRAVAQGNTRLVQWYHQYGEAGTEGYCGEATPGLVEGHVDSFGYGPALTGSRRAGWTGRYVRGR